ncbi:hypothetical protein L208DRAFT_1375637 [Tricholoma matsutake]|nr:hypothetical protein L208DRAFT_1375637 [Tricholoma matsutake 945]
MKDKGKGRAVDGITITNKLKVDKIECLTAVPLTWTVPCEKTAYLVDLMEMDEAPTKSSGNILSLDAYIRAEDQESWGGLSGHTKGDAQAAGFEDDHNVKILCQHAQLTCNGVDTCQYIDPALFGDCEHYEPDEDAMHELWNHELDANEHEASSVAIWRWTLETWETPLHSYTHIVDGKILMAKVIQQKCPTEMIIFVPVNKDVCKALVILRKPHNHPIHPKMKPSLKDKEKLSEAVHAVGITGLIVQKLMNGMESLKQSHLDADIALQAGTTSLVYEGESIAASSTAFMD